MGADAARRASHADEIAQMQALVREAMAPAPSASPAAPARRTTARAACRCPRGWPSEREMAALVDGHGRGRPRRLHADQGRRTRRCRSSSRWPRRTRPAGDGRRAAAQQHQPAARCSTTSTRSAAANARGHRLLGQVSCCPLTMDFTLASPYPVEGLASWKPALGQRGEALLAVLRDPAFRARRARRAGRRRRPSASSTANGTRCTWSRWRAPRTRALRAAQHRRHRRAPGPRPARHDARPRARRGPAHHLHGAAAQQRRGRGGRHAQPPAQPGQPERRRRAPHLLQRRRLRPAPARPLGARARRDDARRCGAPADLASGATSSACASAA